MDDVSVQHDYDGYVNVTVFSSSIYWLQMSFLRHLGVLQLGGGNERNALQNKFDQSPMHLCGKGRRKKYLLNIGGEFWQSRID